MKYYFVFILPIFIFTFCSTSSNDKQQIEELSSSFDKEEVNDQESDSATFEYYNNDKLSQIEQEIISKPESPNVYYKRAIYYKLRKKYALALEDINRSLKLSPDASVFNYEKADILYQQGVFILDVSKIDEAEIYLNHTLSLDEDYENALLLKAKILLYKKETDASMKLVNQVLRLNKTRASGYFTKGMIYHFLGNKDLAASSYQTAIEMDANYYDAYMNLGLIYSEDQNDKALSYYNSAIDIYPQSIEAHRNKGLHYHFSKNYELARVSFENVIELDPTFEEAYFNIGNTYIGSYSDTMSAFSKDTTLNQAIYFFEKAIDLNPNYVQAIYNLGLQHEFKGDKQRAKKFYLQAIEIDNNYAPALSAINQL